MSNFIQQIYYGNISPQELSSEISGVLKKKLSKLSEKEEKLSERLNGGEKELFLNYAIAYNEFSSLSNEVCFISGFRFGAKFTYDTFITKGKD